MAGGKAARRQRHRHGTQERRQQGNEVEKLLGPLQRLPQFGTAILQRLDPHTAHLRIFGLVQRPGHKVLDPAVLARHRHPVAHAAGRLDQFGGRHIGAIDHDARRKIHEAGTPVRLIDNDFCHPQAGVAQQQDIPHLDADAFQQGRLDPGFTGRRDVLGQGVWRARLVRDLEAAAQGVTGLDNLQGHQLGAAALGVAGAGHGGKAQGLDHVQAQCTGLGRKHGRRRVVAGNHGVAAEQLARVALQTAFQPVGKKTHGGQGRHRQRHRNNE